MTERAEGFWWVRRAERVPRGEGITVRPWAHGLVRWRTVHVLHDDGVSTTADVDDPTIEWGPYLGKGPEALLVLVRAALAVESGLADVAELRAALAPFSEPYREGKAARQRGARLDENPHPPYGEAFSEWEHGFIDGVSTTADVDDPGESRFRGTCSAPRSLRDGTVDLSTWEPLVERPLRR